MTSCDICFCPQSENIFQSSLTVHLLNHLDSELPDILLSYYLLYYTFSMNTSSESLALIFYKEVVSDRTMLNLLQ